MQTNVSFLSVDGEGAAPETCESWSVQHRVTKPNTAVFHTGGNVIYNLLNGLASLLGTV